MQRKLYAAYGSNLHIHQMKARCPDAYVIGHGYIYDFELEFRSVANIKQSPGQNVPIVLWSISKMDEVALDRYEGVSSGLYRKETLEVHLELGEKGSSQQTKKIFAMVYLMNVDESRPLAAPSPYYYEIIRDGYMHHGLPFSPLAVAAILSGASYIDEGVDQD
ncbi:gamma-glutamylcyclotransferase family protein [Paenibacillus sp. EPM92]|uniref:gamma-glutamylcyclotransferase family protein n=1 Tax=Paenibacillus sp. EPM92 TaxID=1561195 RepID=UPI0019162DB2|nr:gamma-glutamylcyclotransferase family protein [Paenibacillus sp. EPM92]